MIFNISRFFHSLKIFIEYLLCVLYICLQNHPENEKLSPFYKGDIQEKLKSLRLHPPKLTKLKFKCRPARCYNPRFYLLDPAPAQTLRTQGWLWIWVEGMVQAMILWQERKCLHLSLEATQIRLFFFVELSFKSQKIAIVSFSYFPLSFLFFFQNKHTQFF